jgi:hypothetical protein
MRRDRMTIHMDQIQWVTSVLLSPEMKPWAQSGHHPNRVGGDTFLTVQPPWAHVVSEGQRAGAWAR